MTAEEQDDARKMGLSIKAGHGVGKGATLSGIGLHFHFAMPQPKGIITAPAGPQLSTSLWPEFAKHIHESPYLQELFVHQSDKIFLRDRGSKTYCIWPRTIQPNSSPEAQVETLAGVHSTSVLYCVDEATGVPEPVFKPLEGGLTDPVALIILIYNPVRMRGFAIESQSKNRRDWICLHWDGEETKRQKAIDPKRYWWFNEQAQERLASKYGRESDYYRARVRGLEPRGGTDTLIPLSWVMDAVDRTIAESPTDPLLIGIDVGGGEADGDPTVVLVRRGNRHIATKEFRDLHSIDLALRVSNYLMDYLIDLDQTQYAIGVDSISIGKHLYDHLVHVMQLQHVYGVNVGESALEPERFHRLRDEIWWWLREAFESQSDPLQILNDDELIGEVTAPKWEEPGGKIKVESKLKMRNRGVSSPNKADALCITEYLKRRCVSRLPAGARRNRRVRRELAQSWKVV